MRTRRFVEKTTVSQRDKMSVATLRPGVRPNAPRLTYFNCE